MNIEWKSKGQKVFNWAGLAQKVGVQLEFWVMGVDLEDRKFHVFLVEYSLIVEHN